MLRKKSLNTSLTKIQRPNGYCGANPPECKRRGAAGDAAADSNWSGGGLQESAARSSAASGRGQHQHQHGVSTSKPCYRSAVFGLDVIDTSKCTVEGADTKAEVNKPAKLTLHLMDSTGHSYISLSSIEAKVKITRGWLSPLQPQSLPSEEGTYHATYTPHIRGRHSATVNVDGKETLR